MPKRGGRVAPPPGAGEWDVRFGDAAAVEGWERLSSQAPGPTRNAWLEAALLDDGSQQADVWGINLYPARYDRPDWLEFDSVINLRPRHGNRSRSVDDPRARGEIAEIVARLVMP